MSGRKANLNFIDTRRNIGKRAKLLEETVGVLSLYEQQRTPIPPIEDDRKMQLEVRKLNVELTCPVCLGILRETMTVMECLHRFCSECINTCLRLGKKECPTCRVHCASRRHMRRDPNFDALISTIYPRLDEFEEQADSWVKKINENVNRTSLRDSVEAGMKRQAAAKAKARRPTPSKKPATPPRKATKRKASPPLKSTHGEEARGKTIQSKQGDERKGPARHAVPQEGGARGECVLISAAMEGNGGVELAEKYQSGVATLAHSAERREREDNGTDILLACSAHTQDSME